MSEAKQNTHNVWHRAVKRDKSAVAGTTWSATLADIPAADLAPGLYRFRARAQVLCPGGGADRITNLRFVVQRESIGPSPGPAESAFEVVYETIPDAEAQDAGNPSYSRGEWDVVAYWPGGSDCVIGFAGNRSSGVAFRYVVSVAIQLIGTDAADTDAPGTWSEFPA